jgi:DNA-binding transcriptional MerR regulator
MAEYIETTGDLARESGVTVQTVVLYANAGFLDYVRMKNGTRLFKPGQAGRVRELCADRKARRGGNPRPRAD